MALTKITKQGVGADAVDATKIADDSISEEHLDITAITGQSELAATADDTDVLLVYDTSAGALKKIQRRNITLITPTFTGITPSNANTGDGTGNHTFVITGTNFDSAPVVKFRGNDGSALISSTSRLPDGCWNVSTANSFCPVCGITNSTLYPAFKIVLFTFTIKLCSVGIE